MLILKAVPSEEIAIGNDIVIQIFVEQGGAIKVGIAAPRDVSVLRRPRTNRVSNTNQSGRIAQEWRSGTGQSGQT